MTNVVLGIDLNQFSLNLHRVVKIIVLDKPLCQDGILILGFDDQALLNIEFGQPFKDLNPVWNQSIDLLENGDGLVGETISGITVGNPLIEFHRTIKLADPPVEITNPIDCVDIVGIQLQELFVLPNCRFNLALLDQLLSSLENLVPVDGH